MRIEKPNESVYCVHGTGTEVLRIIDYLRVQDPKTFFDPLYQAGFKSKYVYFTKSTLPTNKRKESILNLQDPKREESVVFPQGVFSFVKALLPEELVKSVEEQQIFSKAEIDEYFTEVLKTLPFAPYDYQELAFKEAVQRQKGIQRMCTSSGKSMTISLLVDFFRTKGLKGILVVPNINLLTQFKNDIRDYNLMDLYDEIQLLGGADNIKEQKTNFMISTWQSLKDMPKIEADYIIYDEAHRAAADCSTEIIMKLTNCKFKLGFTGTLPEDPIQKMQVISSFGPPKDYITSAELIARGLGTPLEIQAFLFQYSAKDAEEISRAEIYSKQLAIIKEHKKRSEYINKIVCSVSEKGNTLVLFQHTEHGKQIFKNALLSKHPEIVNDKRFINSKGEFEIPNKFITGKKSFEIQDEFNVYFLNGEDDAKTRENTRKIMEDRDCAILVANYALLSTGVNMKKLHYLVLASPMKSYTTVTQSIGRGMRLHHSKSKFVVIDVVDCLGKTNKPSGVFYKQYAHRKKTSYAPESFPVYETVISLAA